MLSSTAKCFVRQIVAHASRTCVCLALRACCWVIRFSFAAEEKVVDRKKAIHNKTTNGTLPEQSWPPSCSFARILQPSRLSVVSSFHSILVAPNAKRPTPEKPALVSMYTPRPSALFCCNAATFTTSRRRMACGQSGRLFQTRASRSSGLRRTIM